jgi:hypothetical protein
MPNSSMITVDVGGRGVRQARVHRWSLLYASVHQPLEGAGYFNMDMYAIARSGTQQSRVFLWVICG